jgi:O-antigen/teichoic acid export membrane protein/serine acetyltransferase
MQGEQATVQEAPAAATPQDGASTTKAIKVNVKTSILIQILNVVSGLELANGLGVTGRGNLAAAILWPTVIGAIATLGLQESMTYHVARDRANAGTLLGSALGLCAIQSILFTAVTAALIPLVLQNHSHAVIAAGLIYTGYVSLNMYGLVLTGTLNGLHQYRSYNLGILSLGVGIVALQTVLLAIGQFHVKTIVIGFVGVYVLCMAYGTWLTKRAHPGRLHFDFRTMRMIFAYGVRSNTSTTSSFLNQRLDQLVISVFLTAHQLGIYVVAVTFTLFAPLLGGAIALAALPNVARLDDSAERTLLSRRLVSFTLIAAALVSLPIIVLAPQLISLLFPGFGAGGNITRVTAIASVSFATTRSLEAVLRGIGRPLAAGMAEFVALGATGVCLAALLPTIGLIGAAYASLIAYTTSGVWMAWRIKKLTGVPMHQLVIPDREGLAIARERFARLRRRPEPAAPQEHGRRTRHADALQRSSQLSHPRRPSSEAFFGGASMTHQRVQPATTEFFGGPAVADPEPAISLTPVTESQTAEPRPDPEPQPVANEDKRGSCRGMTFDQAHAASNELPPREYGICELIWSDYLAHYHYKVETERTRRILFLPRIVTNANLHCNVLVRLIQGTPLWMAWFWRRLLISWHACDFQPFCRIGPGLRMPHPIGILVGHAVLGRDVVLQHHMTISAVTTNWRSGKSPGFVQIGDGVTIFTGTVIAGRVVIGDQAMLGANSLVVRDIPARNILIGGRLRPATDEELAGV